MPLKIEVDSGKKSERFHAPNQAPNHLRFSVPSTAGLVTKLDPYITNSILDPISSYRLVAF